MTNATVISVAKFADPFVALYFDYIQYRSSVLLSCTCKVFALHMLLLHGRGACQCVCVCVCCGKLASVDLARKIDICTCGFSLARLLHRDAYHTQAHCAFMSGKALCGVDSLYLSGSMGHMTYFNTEHCDCSFFVLHPLFCLFALQLLRKCILNMTIPCVVPDGPLGVPPFEKPSIAKVFFLYF